MQLTDWAKKRGHGAYQDLHYESRVSLKTVYKAAKHGDPVVAEIAERLSAAVTRLEERAARDGKRRCGLVSIDEIRFPAKSSTARCRSSAPPSAA